MTGKNATPLIGWHPRPDLVARLKAEVKRRGGKRGVQSAILDEALDQHLPGADDEGLARDPSSLETRESER